MRRRRGFTLVEILMVLAIILLLTVIAVPLIGQFNGRQVADGARVLTGTIAGARDSAIRANEPRGFRLLADPNLTLPRPGQLGAGTLQLCYNRMVAIEPGPAYREGHITIGPMPPVTPTWPPPYPRAVAAGDTWPFPAPSTGLPNVLMVEECVYVGGYLIPNGGTAPQPQSPTSWYWNVRLGEKIRLGETGREYTIVGPCQVSPWGTGSNFGNHELFVNCGPPGTPSPLSRVIYDSTGTVQAGYQPEFLFVVDNDDDDSDGYVDEGWDGFNNNPPPAAVPGAVVNLFVDELVEWETEKWAGTAGEIPLVDSASPTSPSVAWVAANNARSGIDSAYAIRRRAVPAAGAREIALPSGIVVDATTWNTTQERSRLPIDAVTLTCDVMLTPSGQWIANSVYSVPTANGLTAFLHFWLCDSSDVHPRGSVWGLDPTGAPRPNPTAGQSYELPMAVDAIAADPAHPGFTLAPPPGQPFYPPATAGGAPVLKGDRRIVTLNARSGAVVTNGVDSVANPWSPTAPLTASEGFSVNDVGQPFYRPQSGQREPR